MFWPVKEFLKKARKAERAGDYSTAGDFYSLAGEPLKALEAYRKGNLHDQAARLAAGMGDYPAAADSYARNNDFRSAGEMWVKAGRNDKAWRMYKRAGDLRQAAEILEKINQPAEAAGLYEQAGLAEKAARLYAAHGRSADAVRLLEKLIAETHADKLSFDPAERAQRVRRFSEACGKLYLKVNNSKAAAPLLENAGLFQEAAQAYKASGDSPKAVELFMRAGREEEAAGLLEGQQVSAFDPRMVAELMLKRGDHARAAEQFLRAGEPGMAAECFEHAGMILKAADAAHAAHDLMGAARLYRAAQEWKKAAALYREANAQAEAADCLARAGDTGAAAEAHLAGNEFLKAAQILFSRGELDRCIEVLQRIPRDADDAEEGSLLLGQIFEHKALFSLAADCFRRALGSRGAEPATLRTMYRLGRVLEKSGRGEEARRLYEQVAAVDFKFEDVAARVAALASPGASAPSAAAAPALSLQPLEKRYEKLAALGQGREGPLFLGRERAGGRSVVIRRLALDPERDAAKAQRLLQEGQRLARLRHPAIVPLLDAGVDANGVYYISERREGKTLREVLKEGGLPDFGTVVSLLSRLAEALDYAHTQGVVCRNLRPETVLITPQQEVMIVDLGVALRLTEPTAGKDDAALRYAPPELLLRERLDNRSDLYCLGLLGFEAATGSLPFAAPGLGAAGVEEAPRWPEVAARPVPVMVRRVVERCLARDRGKRYATARDLLAELQGAQLLPGAILANRYEVVREAGRGGMGEVYEARDLVLDERVALKTVSGTMEEEALSRFLNEIKLARKITHPNVVRVFTFEQWRDLRFIVMEYIDGPNMAQWLKKCGAPPVEEGARIGCGLAEGLAKAHALGIVHRDIKPENILIDAAGSPHILDFGIARVGASNLTQAGMTIGSPKYMSPEQAEGKAVDARSDLYALGLVLYFLFTGKEAFNGPDARSVLIQQLQKMPESPRGLRPDIPVPLERAILALLAKEPERRPRSAAEVSAVLTPFAAALVHAR